jgi:predicted MPP superfamily phosphohydrolase
MIFYYICGIIKFYKMVHTISHLADIHIKNEFNRKDEYEKVFETTYKSLKEKNPDRIVVVGDLVDSGINISNECKLLAGSFLNSLARIAPVIITKGNHDYSIKNRNRIDSIMTITKLINNPRVTYYSKSGFYEDENIVWVVWDHADRINPWKDIEHKKIEGKTYIDLFHDPINGCSSSTGFEMTSAKYISSKDLKADISMMGDIHLRQKFL